MRQDADYELVFHSADYFESEHNYAADQNVSTVVMHFKMPNPNKRYHMPVMLSPHSYSVWWSK